jgi:acylphosphatase
MEELLQGIQGTISSPSLEGTPLTIKEFKEWIKQAESTPTIDLTQAKIKWAQKRKELEQFLT